MGRTLTNQRKQNEVARKVLIGSYWRLVRQVPGNCRGDLERTDRNEERRNKWVIIVQLCLWLERTLIMAGTRGVVAHGLHSMLWSEHGNYLVHNNGNQVPLLILPSIVLDVFSFEYFCSDASLLLLLLPFSTSFSK